MRSLNDSMTRTSQVALHPVPAVLAVPAVPAVLRSHCVFCPVRALSRNTSRRRALRASLCYCRALLPRAMRTRRRPEHVGGARTDRGSRGVVREFNTSSKEDHGYRYWDLLAIVPVQYRLHEKSGLSVPGAKAR